MKPLTNRIPTKATITLALLLLVTGATFFAAFDYASAHTPAWTIPIYIYAAASPDTLELGNSVTVIYWVNIPPATSAANGIGYLWQNITIDITKPDNTNQSFARTMSATLQEATFSTHLTNWAPTT